MRFLLMPLSVFVLFILLLTNRGYSCPSGQYEQCVLPKPWGGCAQKVCVPNGGSIARGLTGDLARLNQGLVQLGNEQIFVSQGLGLKFGQTAAHVDWPKLSKIDWATAAFIGSFIANGVACIASDGASPGADFSGTNLVCSENACACAAISLVAAIKNRSNLSENDRQSFQGLLSDPKFSELMNRESTRSSVESELRRQGAYQNAPFFDSDGVNTDMDSNDLTFESPDRNN